MSHCTCDYHQEQNKKSEWDISDHIKWTSDDFFKAKEKYMKHWENSVCNHDDDFHADCFACGFKFCKTHLFFAKEKDESVEKAREEERDRILAFISEEFKDEEWTEDVVSFVKNNYKYHEPITNH